VCVCVCGCVCERSDFIVRFQIGEELARRTAIFGFATLWKRIKPCPMSKKFGFFFGDVRSQKNLRSPISQQITIVLSENPSKYRKKEPHISYSFSTSREIEKYLYLFILVNIYIYINMYMHICVYMYIYICICVYVYMYIHIYIHV